MKKNPQTNDSHDKDRLPLKITNRDETNNKTQNDSYLPNKFEENEKIYIKK